MSKKFGKKFKKKLSSACYQVLGMGNVRSGQSLNGRPVGEARRRFDTAVAVELRPPDGPAVEHEPEQVHPLGGQLAVLCLARLAPHVHHVSRTAGELTVFKIDCLLFFLF